MSAHETTHWSAFIITELPTNGPTNCKAIGPTFCTSIDSAHRQTDNATILSAFWTTNQTPLCTTYFSTKYSASGKTHYPALSPANLPPDNAAKRPTNRATNFKSFGTTYKPTFPSAYKPAFDATKLAAFICPDDAAFCTTNSSANDGAKFPAYFATLRSTLFAAN